MGRLIEGNVPLLSEIGDEVRKEKTGGRAPVHELTFWWARKPLVASRGVALASLVEPDFPKEDLGKALGLKSDERSYQADPPSSLVSALRERAEHEDIVLLDPFAGGGSIPFEALRLGIPAIAADHNPVAWLLLKVIEWSKRYGRRLVNPEELEGRRKELRHGFGLDVERLCEMDPDELSDLGDLAYWGCRILRRVREEAIRLNLYPEYEGRKVLAYLWVRQVKCPKCGAWVPLTKDFWLSRKRRIVYDVEYYGDDYRIVIREGGEPRSPTVGEKGRATCPRCGYAISADYVRENATKNDRLAVLLLENREYVPAPPSYDGGVPEGALEGLEEFLPEEEIGEDKRALPVKLYGPRTFRDLFRPRQLFILGSLARAIRDARAEMMSRGYEREYADALTGILSLLLTKHADYNSAFNSWDSSVEKVAHTLSFRGIGVTWNYVEVNPFAKFSGSLWGMFSDILEGVSFAVEKLEGSPADLKVELWSALHIPLPDRSVKLIVTDPPYLDDVPYPEVSDFFYVWLKRTLGDVFPNAFGFYALWRDRAGEDLSVGGYRDEGSFRANMIATLRELRRILSDDGLLVLVFAHASAGAWTWILEALMESGFQVTWINPLRTEPIASVVSKGKVAMESSMVIACRPRPDAPAAYIERIAEDVRAAARNAVEDSWELGYRGADLLIAAYSAALRELTRYSDLRSIRGKADVGGVMGMIEEEVPRAVISNIVKIKLDPWTRFYLYARSVGGYYRERDGWVIPSDDALKIARSFGVELNELLKSSDALVERMAGRGKAAVKLLDFRARGKRLSEASELTRAVDALHAELYLFSEGGMDAVNRLHSRGVIFSGFTQEDVVTVAEALVMRSAARDEELRMAVEFLGALGRSGMRVDVPTGLDAYFKGNDGREGGEGEGGA
ncbi:DUF1156 domain-containing protein [Conexivisphaera calida]|uniref:Adenine-specific DNA methylase containing a Zn-ribbon n=1 Tax=Conexivisphaera calida TaxID=1874277 RepID=A0A4P2VND9_9ARCH|nr:DUF1156 domain-containing protein [Conexivisphaera calida]BBE42445.1 Adenine-specific DNA methylase containing a Zn-ribbon [Conexivisphaera calida]